MEQNRIEIRYDGTPCYDILLEQDFGKLGERLAQLSVKNRKLCIVTDSNVGPLHLEKLAQELIPCAAKVVTFTFPAGEARKSLKTVQMLYEFLIQENFDRNDVLVALGGGVVGDLTGYTAATYLRGIRFVQIPTTLLAMVDSSIGGKTGVDFKAYKNMVGAFYMPQFVYMNFTLLGTLPTREYCSGFGEILKHGLIRDAALYSWLIEKRDLLLQRDRLAIAEMVYRSLLVKKDIVERDPKEKGERALLNFGHTIGHAVEKLKEFRLLHGECVAIGMVAAVQISWKRGMLTETQTKEILSCIQSFQLPISASGLLVEDILLAVSRDKKKDADKIRFILLNGMGNAVIDTNVTEQEMAEACEFIL